MVLSMALCTAPGLREGSCLQQVQVDGKVFPKIFNYDGSREDMLQTLKRNKSFLEEQLHEFGAILLRDFPAETAADFDSLVEGIGWKEVEYLGTAVRSRVVGRAFSATNADPKLAIPFHHEMIQVRKGPPSKILFFCAVEPAEGGQTPILLSHKVAERMRQEFPDFVRKLEEGLIYIKTLPGNTDPSFLTGQGWPTVFQTTDPVKAEERAADYFGATLEWLSSGNVNMVGGPYEPIKAWDKQRGREAWFNLLVAAVDHADNGVLINRSSEAKGGYIVLFKDGTPVPREIVARCREIHEEFSVDIPWKKGDIMVLDNLAVMHGRRPCHHPRKILVALCD